MRIVPYGYDPATGRTHDTWIFRRGNHVERHRISLRRYNGAEMRRLLTAAGFRDIRLYATPAPGKGTSAGPLTRHSRRLIAVARDVAAHFGRDMQGFVYKTGPIAVKERV